MAINLSHLWLVPAAGGWGKVRLQVCVQLRCALLDGFSRQPEAESEGRSGRHPAPQRGGRPPHAQLWGGGSLPGWRRGAGHPGAGFPWRLPVLDSAAWKLQGTWDNLNKRTLKLTEQRLSFSKCPCTVCLATKKGEMMGSFSQSNVNVSYDKASFAKWEIRESLETVNLSITKVGFIYYNGFNATSSKTKLCS